MAKDKGQRTKDEGPRTKDQGQRTKDNSVKLTEPTCRNKNSLTLLNPNR
jgi:hypothetical protein